MSVGKSQKSSEIRKQETLFTNHREYTTWVQVVSFNPYAKRIREDLSARYRYEH